MPDFIPEEFEEESPRLTPVKAVLKGVFQLSRVAVPYYLVSMSLEEVGRYLKLVEDMPSDYRSNWTIEELFQRDINWERVDSDIVNGYLRRKEKRTFFNALTVALLPLGKDGHLAKDYPRDINPYPKDGPFGHAEYRTVTIGGVQVATRKASDSSVAYLRWDEGSVFPATIDGQHRLAALRRFAESTALTAAQRATRVPVILLVLHEDVGFHIEPERESDNPLLSVVREIFIDLNKHAQEVSVTRQVLLDDQEMEARATRSLFVNRIGVDSDDSLPLGLVNWKDDSIKFDSGPYLTTVNTLYLTVKELLGFSYPRDPLDEGHVRRFIQSIDNRLSVSEVIRSGKGPNNAVYEGKPDLTQFVMDEYFGEDPTPFKALPYEYATAAVDGFILVYKPLIVGLFQHYAPYAAFRALSNELGGITGDLAFYNGQTKVVQRQLREDDWGEEEYHNKVKDPAARLSEQKKGKWAYMVVFQKALVRATVDAYFQSSVTLGREVSAAEFVGGEWKKFLNDQESNGTFSLDAKIHAGDMGQLWEGISKNPSSLTIKYTNASAGRIRDLLLLLWYGKHSNCKSGGEFLDNLSRADSNELYPDASKAALRVINSLKSAVRVRHEEDLEEQKLIKESRDRLIGILDTAVF